MANNNETFAAIVEEMNCSHEGMIAFEFQDYAFRIAVAHKREVAAKDAEIEKLRFDIMTLKSEQRTAGEVIIEQTNKVMAKDAEIAELRECVKQGIDEKCRSCKAEWYGKCLTKDGGDCELIAKWRKALEGGHDEGK